MKRIIIRTLRIVVTACVIYACKKDYDYPPLKIPDEGARISIAKLKERLAPPSTYYKFRGGDTNLFCIVLNDEVSGNFYQQIFVRDEAGGAIQLNLKESGGLYRGDRIRINLNNLYLISANSMIFLDSVDIAKNVVKLSSGNEVPAKRVNLDEILLYSTMPTNSNSLQSQLVELYGMEFKTNSLVTTYADAIGKTSVTQTISSCEAWKTITVRTSGRSNFAGKSLPKGNGSIIGIVSQYNTTMQLTLRDHSDVNMNGPLCTAPVNTMAPGVLLVKDFTDNSLTSGGWIQAAVTNTNVNWSIGTSSATPGPFAMISGYIGGNTNSETWLISPLIDLSTAKDPVLSFKTAAKFSGTALEVLVSGNYTGGDPASASWTSLAPNYALSPTSSDYLWVPSGYVSLNAYKTSSVRISFKYTSSNTGASSYRLDEIVVKEK